MKTSFSLKALFTIFIIFSFAKNYSNGRVTEILLDDTSMDDLSSKPCHVDIEVPKRVVGKCVKAGHIKACIIGETIHPYHPECYI